MGGSPDIDRKHVAAGVCSFEPIGPPAGDNPKGKMASLDVEDISKNVSDYLSTVANDADINRLEHKSRRAALESDQQLKIAISTAIFISTIIIFVVVCTLSLGIGAILAVPLFGAAAITSVKNEAYWNKKSQEIRVLDLKYALNNGQINGVISALLLEKGKSPKDLPFVQFMQKHFADKPNVHGAFTNEQLIKMHRLFSDSSIEKDNQIAVLLKEIRLQQLIPVLESIISPKVK